MQNDQALHPHSEWVNHRFHKEQEGGDSLPTYDTGIGPYTFYYDDGELQIDVDYASGPNEGILLDKIYVDVDTLTEQEFKALCHEWIDRALLS